MGVAQLAAAYGDLLQLVPQRQTRRRLLEAVVLPLLHAFLDEAEAVSDDAAPASTIPAVYRLNSARYLESLVAEWAEDMLFLELAEDAGAAPSSVFGEVEAHARQAAAAVESALCAGLADALRGDLQLYLYALEQRSRGAGSAETELSPLFARVLAALAEQLETLQRHAGSDHAVPLQQRLLRAVDAVLSAEAAGPASSSPQFAFDIEAGLLAFLVRKHTDLNPKSLLKRLERGNFPTRKSRRLT